MATTNIPQFSREAGTPTTILYYSNGKLVPVDIKNLTMTDEERARVGYNGYQGISDAQAYERFQSQYGFDARSLPEASRSDLAQSIAEAYGYSSTDQVFQGTENVKPVDALKGYATSQQNPTTTISKEADPNNPQGAVIKVDGVTKQDSPSIEEQQAGTGAGFAGAPPNQAQAYLTPPQGDPTTPGGQTASYVAPPSTPPTMTNDRSTPPVQDYAAAPVTTSTLQAPQATGFIPPEPTVTYPVASLPTPQPQMTDAAPLTPTQQSAQDLVTQLEALNMSTVGRSAYQTEQETKFGVDKSQQAINDLAAQLIGIKNEAAAIPLQLMQGASERGVTTGLLGAQENSRLRTNAIAALGVSTLLAAAQGQLANAQMLANKAVAQKYDPIQEQINALTNNLNLIMNSPQYSAEEKARAAEQLRVQEQRQYELDRARAREQEIHNIAVQSAGNMTNFRPTSQFPTVSVALQAIQSAPDPVTAAQIAAATGLTGDKTVDYVTYTEGNELVQYASDPRTGQIDPSTRKVIRTTPKEAEKNSFETRQVEGTGLVEYELDPQGRIVGQRVIQPEVQGKEFDSRQEGDEFVQYEVDPKTGEVKPDTRKVISTQQGDAPGIVGAQPLKTTYVEFGTGKQVTTVDQIQPNQQYIESGTGRQVTGQQILTENGGGGQGSFSDFTDQEQRKLQQAGLQNASYDQQLNYLYGEKQGDGVTTETERNRQVAQWATRFTPDFQYKLQQEFNDDELYTFMLAYKEAEQQSQSSINPDTFLEAWLEGA